MTASATVDIDLFSDEHLLDPYPNYSRLRAMGPVTWLENIQCWVVSQYEPVRRVLDDTDTFSSAQGIGLNDMVNQALDDTLIGSDPPRHDTLRDVLGGQLAPKAIRALGESITERAKELILPLVAKGRFDAIGDLARVFPPTIVADLVGIPEAVRPRLISWGDAMFQLMGPADKPRTFAGGDLVNELYTWLGGLDPAELTEGSWGRAIYQAADEGRILPKDSIALLSAYTAAGMDTTINALGWAVRLFSVHQDQWTALREDRSLVSAAFNEIIRLESPVQMFSRVATKDVDFEGTQIQAGQRVVVLYGSANRDEAHFGADADSFDITRSTTDHLAFGYGVHGCVGQALARLEAHSALNILADSVERFDAVSEPVVHLNNAVRGLESYEVSVVPA